MTGEERFVDVLRWYTPFLQGRPFDVPTCIGVVALVDRAGRRWRAYLGPGTGLDETGDAAAIAAWGAPVDEDVARAYAAGRHYAEWEYRQ